MIIDGKVVNRVGRWNIESIRTHAKQFASRVEFQRGAPGCFKAAKRLEIVDDVFPLTVTSWDKEKVFAAAACCETRSEFSKRFSGAYSFARLNGMLDELHAVENKTWWTEDLVREEALKYDSKLEFGKFCVGAYEYALREGFINELFEDKYRWWKTEEAIRDEASKYSTKSEFIKGCPGAYKAARRFGILDDLGFTPGAYGYDSSTLGYLYIADIRLTDSSDGVLIGIANRSPFKRYRVSEQEHISNGNFYVFANGSHALSIEGALKRHYISKSITREQCPLKDKLGTSGEILTGVQRSLVEITLLDTMRDFSFDYEWSEEW